MRKDFGGVVGTYTERKFNWTISNTKNRINELNLNYWYDLYQDKYIAFYFYKLHVRFKQFLISENLSDSFNTENLIYINTFRNLLLSNLYSKVSELSGYCEQPNNKQFWIFRGWSEEDATMKVSTLQRNNSLKFIAKRKENPELYADIYKNQIGYWLKQGYSEEESKKLVSERQRTFTLEKCLQRYGEIEGRRIFNERQIKWQKTLNSKSKEEIDDINRRKSAGLGNYLNRNVPGKLYYIRFYNSEIEFWKIGVTVRELEQRFGLSSLEYLRKLKYEIIFVNIYSNIDTAYIQEQYILNVFTNNRITINYNGFQTTEAFNKDVLEKYNTKELHEKNNN